MGTRKRILEGIIIGTLLIAPKIAKAGQAVLYHNTNIGVGVEWAGFRDNDADAEYHPLPDLNKMIAYTENSPGDKKTWKGVYSQKFEKNKVCFKTQNIVEGTPRSIKIRFLDNSGYENRNVILKQDPNNKNADPNIYDVLGLTNWGTEEYYIGLPDTVVPDANNAQEWYVISTNLADINFDGKCNFLDLANLGIYWGTSGHGQHDNWANFADINRDGDVNFIDQAILSDNWLWDGTTE
jgi:hypothetical protein